MESDRLAERLLPLFREQIRPLLEEHNAPTLDALDQLASVLEAACARKERLDFGFVGESQVGKSTLINALIGGSTLPSGGIGPLTAQATEVSYADENSVWVRYHERTKVNQLIFSIERYLENRGDHVVVSSPGADVEDSAEELIELTESAEPAKRSEKGEYFLEQARLMITGGQGELSVAGLLDGLRAILGHAPGSATQQELAPHAERLAMLRAKCNSTETLTAGQLGGDAAFRSELRMRAAGALAPLVAELKVKLRTPFLRYATLVDLPGIGVVGDPAAEVAEEFVRLRGNALVIVTRNNGLPETLAQLLERTGVITKLLFAGSAEPPIHVMIAVTHLDSVAKTRFSELNALARETGGPRPDRHAIFKQLSSEMQARVRMQVEAALRASQAFEDLPPEKHAKREEIVSKLCASLDVLVVAANDFMHLSQGDDDLAFLKDLEATGVPGFRERVQLISSQLVARRRAAIDASLRDLVESLDDQLQAIAEQYEEGGGRASADWERFRDELGAFVAPLREEMRAHQAETMAALRTTLPTKIELLCSNAEKLATAKLMRLRKRGEQELAFQSLDAALRRDGVWNRRGINYPESITRAFVDSVAIDWEPMIIDAVRTTMVTLAEREVALVEQLCKQAERYDERIVGEAHIETQKKLLKQQARACISWTREQLEGFRKDVQEKLIVEVAAPIAKAATQARQAGRNQGTGAKRRILDAFEEGGTKAIVKARERALQVLNGYYAKLRADLTKNYMESHHDPLKAAFDALTNEEQARARRSDAQRRRRVLDAIASHRGALAQVAPAVAA